MKTIKNSKPLVLLLLTGAVFFFLQYISPLVAPVLAAMLFVTIFGSLLQKIQAKLHIHRQIGAILLLLLAVLVLALLIWILFSWLAGSLPQWLGGLNVLEGDVSVLVGTVSESVGKLLGVDSTWLENTLLGFIKEGIDFFRLELVPDMLSQSLTYVKVLGALGGFLVTFLIAAVLLAKDYDRIMNRMLDQEEYHVLLEVICGIIRYIATFVRAEGIIMISTACLSAAVLGLAGIRQGLIWGIVAGIMDVLPFVGTGIVLLPLGVVQLFQGYYGRAVVCGLLYIACIFLRELLEPRLIGRRIGVNPIAVLLSLYAGLRLFGVWGIVKGPLGFIIIYQTYLSLQRRWAAERMEAETMAAELYGDGED